MLTLKKMMWFPSQVCNHPELFERNEGQSSVHFAVVPHSLPPPPFGALEDVHFAGGYNPVSYKVLDFFWVLYS